MTTHDLILGDCLPIMRSMTDQTFDLVYLDPPFLTQRTHRLSPRDRSTEFSFPDVWESSSEYAAFLGPRLREMHRLLKSSGSLFFHCDRRASHIARALLDNIFGEEMLRSEIIWSYKRWSNSSRALLPSHQTIYFYSKTSTYKFNLVFADYSHSTNVDQILQRRSRDAHGKAVYKRDGAGRTVFGVSKRGVPLGDVWDIPYLNPKAIERTGYPTQKPVLLLERIIGLCTDPADSVLDPFCGSGTTLVAATLLGRNAVGIDASAEAVALTRTRLQSPHRTSSGVLEKGRHAYNQADSEALALLQGLDLIPIHRNRGIDALLREPDEGGTVPIRVQRKGESIREAAHLLFETAKKKGASKMILVVTANGGQAAVKNDLPEGVITVEATALAIQRSLCAPARRRAYGTA